MTKKMSTLVIFLLFTTVTGQQSITSSSNSASSSPSVSPSPSFSPSPFSQTVTASPMAQQKISNIDGNQYVTEPGIIAAASVGSILLISSLIGVGSIITKKAFMKPAVDIINPIQQSSWRTVVDGDDIYYFNSSTGESVWLNRR